MNTEIDNVQNVEQKNTVRKYPLQRLNLMIEEEWVKLKKKLGH